MGKKKLGAEPEIVEELEGKEAAPQSDGTKISLNAFMRKHPARDFYINALIRKTFQGQVKTVDEWKRAVQELLGKNL